MAAGQLTLVFYPNRFPGLTMADSAALLAHSMLVIAAATLFWVALTDLREFKIRNEFVVVLAVLYFLYVALSAGHWLDAGWHVLFAVGMLAAMLYYYSQNLMGGGDVKLLAIAFLWTGLRYALPFVVLMAIFALGCTFAAKRGWLAAQKRDNRTRIPLAPSIAGALICTMASAGYLGPLA